MKIKSYLLWLLFVCIVGIHSISALNIKDNNVVTESGYTMTYDQYDKLSKNFHYTDRIIDSKTAEELDKLLSNNLELVGSDITYVVTDYILDSKRNIIFSRNREFKTIEEANNAKLTPVSLLFSQMVLTDGSNIHQTQTKVVIIDCYHTSGSNQYEIDLDAYWIDYTPVVKKFDIMAVRWTNNASLVSASGKQYYNSANPIDYPYGVTNMKVASKAVGISMNLVDSGSNWILHLNAVVNGNPGVAYGTYQHAKNSNVTLAISQSYTFSSSGLGGVVYFSNNTYRGYYDGMGGVYISPRTI